MHLATSSSALLTRAGIRWRNIDPGMVLIEIDIENPGDEPIGSDGLVIQAAPFGAFLPWRELRRVPVEGLQPRERRRVQVSVPSGELPSAPSDYETSSTHWVGNLNVWFERAPEAAVERHCAFDVKVPAGERAKFLLFMEPGPSYSFRVAGLEPGWDATVSEFEAVPVNPNDLSAKQLALYRTAGSNQRLVVQTASEPSHCHLGVEVGRDTDDRVVLVEFQLEATRGELRGIGCVDVGSE